MDWKINCDNSDETALERLWSALWDSRKTISEQAPGWEQELEMLQNNIGWALLHILRAHPTLVPRLGAELSEFTEEGS